MAHREFFNSKVHPLKKIIVIAIVVIVVGAAVGAYYLLSNLNSIVAAAIEKHGSEVTQARVGVSGVDISLREGRGSIKGLSVSNPEGFSAHDAFSLEDITIDIDLGSVRKEPIVIDEIRIQAPVIHAEVNERGATNIDALRKRVGEHTSSSGGSGGGESGEQKRIRIKKFVFEKGSIAVDATALGVEKKTLALPAIHMNDIGGPNGAMPDEIAKVVLTRVAKDVSSEIAASEVNRLIEDQLDEGIADKAKDLLKKIGN